MKKGITIENGSPDASRAEHENPLNAGSGTFGSSENGTRQTSYYSISIGSPFGGLQPRRTRQQRRRIKFIRFLVCEILTTGAMFLVAILGTSQRFTDESLSGLFRILVFSTAVAAALIPVIFYGLPRARSK